jgi:glutamate racemase
MADRPIGIFDSGIGGLTVAHAILERLPAERILYFGDTAHLPYGDKSSATIRRYADRIAAFLLERDCKAIVIACNSASSAAYGHLERRFGHRVPVFNVIDPVVEAVVARPDLRKVGVIGTKATVRAGAYPRKLKRLRPGLDVHSLATPLLAPMIEEGFFHNNISRAVLASYLERRSLRGIEALVMACTHYPLIRDDIEAHYGGRVELFDTPGLVADAVAAGLRERGLLRRRRGAGAHAFCVSDYTDAFARTTRIFWGEAVRLEPVALGE